MDHMILIVEDEPKIRKVLCDFMKSRAVDTQIKRLMEKLGEHSDCIKTVIKAGYGNTAQFPRTQLCGVAL